MSDSFTKTYEIWWQEDTHPVIGEDGKPLSFKYKYEAEEYLNLLPNKHEMLITRKWDATAD